MSIPFPNYLQKFQKKWRITPYKRITSVMPHKRINAKSREAGHRPREAARGLPKGSPPSKSGGVRFACAGPQAIIKTRASRAFSWPLCSTRKRVYLAGGMAKAHRKALSAIQAAPDAAMRHAEACLSCGRHGESP
jgi:hypothetical protein